MGPPPGPSQPGLRGRGGLARPAHRQDHDRHAAAQQLETIDGIVGRVVGEQLNSGRLEGLLRIGVDEVSYRKGHRYLTVVADHDQGGRVVWAGEGRNTQVLEAFYDELGEAGCARLQAISLDLGRVSDCLWYATRR